jgi:hypothetical protein
MRPVCRHCKKNLACRPRQLCTTCHHWPGIREQYPVSDSPFASRGTGNGNSPSPLPAEPTGALPGTPEREAVLSERASRGEALHHPGDATW